MCTHVENAECHVLKVGPSDIYMTFDLNQRKSCQEARRLIESYMGGFLGQENLNLRGNLAGQNKASPSVEISPSTKNTHVKHVYFSPKLSKYGLPSNTLPLINI